MGGVGGVGYPARPRGQAGRARRVCTDQEARVLKRGDGEVEKPLENVLAAL